MNKDSDKKVNNGKLEIEKSDQQAWAFTVKVLGKKSAKHEDYVDVIGTFNKYGFIKKAEFEKDSKGLLHVHGILLLRKGFLRKKLCLHGFHTKLVEMYDEVGWTEYILKDLGKGMYLFDPKYCPPDNIENLMTEFTQNSHIPNLLKGA